jgi:hypothetical protein
MTQARPATQASPSVAIILGAALSALLAVSALLTTGGLAFPSIDLPGERGEASPAQILAEREWERQRHQISGYLDPTTSAEREWERIRKQLSGAFQ